MKFNRAIDRLLVGNFNRRFVSKPKLNPEQPESIGVELLSNGARRPFLFDAASRMKHLVIRGGTGAGKTNLVAQLVEADIKEGRTVAILDMRGDFIDRISGFVAAHPDMIDPARVFLIDLRNPGRSSGLNLFRSSTDPFSAALQMHEVIKSEAANWGVQLDETLRACLIALSFARRTLTELPRLLSDADFRDRLLVEVADPTVQEFFGRFDSLSPDRQQTWVQPVLNKISPLLGHPAIREIMDSTRPIDLPQVLDTPETLLLCGLGADRLHGLAGTFGSLLVSAIENAVMQRVDRPEANRNPVHLYLDEFEHFASPAFESILSEGRRFALGLTLSHQNISQTPTRLHHLIANNAAYRVYFQTGVVDGLALAPELSRMGIDDPVQRMLTLPVGEAIVVRQGYGAQHVRFRRASNPKPSQDALATLHKTLESRNVPSSLPVPNQPPKPAIKHVRRPKAGASDAD